MIAAPVLLSYDTAAGAGLASSAKDRKHRVETITSERNANSAESGNRKHPGQEELTACLFNLNCYLGQCLEDVRPCRFQA